MATTAELEKKVQSLESALSQAEDAIRRLGQQDNNVVEMLSKISGEVATLKVDVANLKVSVSKVAAQAQRAGANVSRYE